MKTTCQLTIKVATHGSEEECENLFFQSFQERVKLEPSQVHAVSVLEQGSSPPVCSGENASQTARPKREESLFDGTIMASAP